MFTESESKYLFYKCILAAVAIVVARPFCKAADFTEKVVSDYKIFSISLNSPLTEVPFSLMQI